MCDIYNDFPNIEVEIYYVEDLPFLSVTCLCGKEWGMGYKFYIGDALRNTFMTHWLNECPIRLKEKELQNV